MKSCAVSLSISHLRTSSLIFLFLLGLSFLNVYPQKSVNKGVPGKVRGVLIDAQTGRPVEAANFILTLIKDSSKVVGTASDKDGKFLLENISAGLYRGRISCIGYKIRLRKAMNISGDGKEINLDTIKLEPKNFSTAEVLIKGERERLIKEKDKFILRPDRELGSNALEFLENSPMVSVDMDDKIKLLGQDAEIYINGIPAKNMGITDSRDLKMYSITEIEKIEVVPEYSDDFPEAREGRVINIVTKKTGTSKYTGNFGAGATTRDKYEGSAAFNYLLPGMKFSGVYYKDYSNHSKNNSSLKNIIYNGIENRYEQFGSNQTKYNADNYRLSYSLFSDFFNSLDYNASYKPQNTDNTNCLINNSSNNLGFVNNVESRNISNTEQRFFNNNISYRRIGPNEPLYFSGDLTYMHNSMDRKNDISQTGSYLLNSEMGNNYLSSENSRNLNNNYALRIITRYKFDTLWSMFCMINSNYQRLAMDNDFYGFDNSQKSYFEKTGQKIRQENSDFIISGSYAVRTTIWNLNISGGFDFNNKVSRIKDDVKNYSYSPDFFSITPNINIGIKFSPEHQFNFAYFRTTINPQNRQLNPYADYSDSTSITSGNPGLYQAKSNNFSIGSTNLLEGMVFQAKVSYANSYDLIEQVTTVESDKITRTTYQNIGKSESYRFSLIAGFQMGNNFGANLLLFGNKNKYEGFMKKAEGMSISSMLKSGFKLWGLGLNFELNYSSPNYSAQSKSNSVFYANAGIRALFFDKNLSVGMKVQDIFNSRNRNSENFGSGFNFVNRVSETTRIVSLNVIYYFRSQAREDMEEKRPEEYGDDF